MDKLPAIPAPLLPILENFGAIVASSTPATIGVVLSSSFGYGISFVLLDYRRALVKKAHLLMHAVVGIGYTATIFTIVNVDLLSRSLTFEQITMRMPITLLVSFVVAFVIIVSGMLWRERRSPYSRSSDSEVS